MFAKSIARGIVLCLSVLMLASCAGQPTDSPQPPASDAPSAQPASSDAAPSSAPSQASGIVTPPGEFPIVTEPVTLKFFAQQSSEIPDVETNDMTTMYEEKTGVHIEWEMVPSNALDEKKSISLASGQYPDVYFGVGISREEEMTYGPKGIFLPLGDLMEQYNPEFKKLWAEDPTIPQMMTAYDGNIYSYPYVQETLHVDLQNRYWINTSWLTKLGLSAPTTPDELYDVLKAFKERDPNGNGKADEIPLIISSVRGSSGMGFLMCPFIYYDGQDGLIVSDDDRVSASFNTPEWREGLRFMSRLYADGLLDKTSFSVTGDQIKQLVETESGEIVGSLTNMAPSGFANLAGERHKSFDALTPLKGPTGLQTCAWFPYAHLTGEMVITKACKTPEVAARWVDWFYTWEGALTSREGPEGLGWKRPDPGTLSYTGEEATWERLSNFGEASNFKWNGLGTFPHNMLIHPQQASNNDIYANNGQPARLYQAAKNQYEPYKPNKVYPPVYMDVDVIKDYSKMKTDINKYVEDFAVRFITGEADIETDWDSYLSNFEKLKLDEYLRMSQEAYDSFLARSK